jgi:hypothetical protein
MPLRNPDQLAPILSKTCRACACVLALLIGTLLLASCTPRRGLRQDEVWECTDKASPECAAAREHFQLVRYLAFPPAHLVAASARALGDLNFDTNRDDDKGKVSGVFIASAPTHSGQLDGLLRKNLKSYVPAAVSAEVEILPLPDQDIGADVRLRLYFAAAGAAAQPIDSVAPYQIFFSQLGRELGAAPAPPR